MATLTYKYPVKINGKIYKEGEAVDEQLVADSAKKINGQSSEQFEAHNHIDDGENGSEDTNADIELTEMSLSQLKQFAKDNGFDITGRTTKAQIIEAIEKA